MDNKKTRSTFNEGQFLMFDSETMPYKEFKHFSHFALTDALITHAGATQQPIIHFWQTSPLAILGMMDSKITHFTKAVNIFAQYDHDYIIRNSGGLAVVSDPGVLNVSLIYPSPKEKRLAINAAYDFMLDFIRQTLYPHFPSEIKAYEISNSYCFGDYDLSIKGQKIAGISQRRIQDGVAVMIYISINGDQDRRANMLKEFYDEGLAGTEPAGRYPNIKSDVMTTLADAYGVGLTVAEVKEMMLTHFTWAAGEYTPTIASDFTKALDKMYQRNARVLGENFVTESLK